MERNEENQKSDVRIAESGGLVYRMKSTVMKMKRMILLLLLCICVTGTAGCANRKAVNREIINRTAAEMQEGNEDMDEGTAEESRSTGAAELTYEEMVGQFYEQFYSGLSDEEIDRRITEGAAHYQASKYYSDVVDYWENTREARDISNVLEPLYFTDMKYYKEEDFRNDPPTVIHLAKNEIYAKHGYIFKDEDLNNYFLGCAWYQPSVTGAEFDDSVFNDFERKNLELLAELDRS